jgi:protein phosphatase
MKYQLFPPLSIYELGQRSNQEDALYPLNGEATSSDRLFVLCDGMGGHEKGEVASQTVCQSLGKWFAEHVMPDCPFSDDMLREAIEYAFAELDKRDDGAMKKMGTTLTLIYMHRHGVTAAHIGDSRIYHIRPISPHKLGGVRGGLNAGVLYQSRDHSLAFDLFQSGEITYEEMATFPQKNIITRAMQPGKENRVRVDIVHITDIQPNDYFFMCSDGMLEQMTNEELVALLSSDISDEEKRSQLIKATANNKDNHTAWLIHIKDVIKEDSDDNLVNEEPKARCNAINIIPKVVATQKEDDVVIVNEEKKSVFQRIRSLFNR